MLQSFFAGRKVGFALFGAVLFLAGCFLHGELPAIDNPEQLKSDCEMLLKRDRTQPLQPADWPESVKRLHPVYVNHLDRGILIATYAKVGAKARGYVVGKMPPQYDELLTISRGPADGIYRFDFKVAGHDSSSD